VSPGQVRIVENILKGKRLKRVSGGGEQTPKKPKKISQTIRISRLLPCHRFSGAGSKLLRP